MVITLLLALLLQALAASALVAPGQAARADACTSSAGAALADGDDVRARFLTRFMQQSKRATSSPLIISLDRGLQSDQESCDLASGLVPSPLP